MGISGFQLALIVGAVLCAVYSKDIPHAHIVILSKKIPRSFIWIVAGAASFILSTAWARYDLEYAPAFTFTMDACVALAIYLFGGDDWEVWVYNIFRAQVLVSIIYLMGPISIPFSSYQINFSHWIYVVCLEALNWAALAVIWRKAKFEKATKDEDNFSNPWAFNILGFGLNLRAQRAQPPFTKVRK